MRTPHRRISRLSTLNGAMHGQSFVHFTELASQSRQSCCDSVRVVRSCDVVIEDKLREMGFISAQSQHLDLNFGY